MIKQIATVAVYVEDQQKAKTFWSEKVGFDIIAELMGPNAFWLEVAPKGDESRLVIYPKSMMKDSEFRKASIVFQCDNIASTYETMNSNGVEFLGEPQTMQWGTFLSFKDEDGNEYLLRQ
jgi:lactoylglutathione lyase